MKTSPALHITIPQPCSQNWDAMQNVGDGKHCNQCNKIVYDFSQMNDNEVLQFFKQQAAIPCGRFHNSQLNRDILPVITRRKLFVARFNKIAAALFAVLSFRSFSSTANNKNIKPAVALDGNYKNNLKSGDERIVISGTVKDRDGKPLEKATIMLDSVLVGVTNLEGKFTIELDNVTLVNHNLYFSFGDLITVVRTYHPVMLSTSYDVVLNKKGQEYSMGMIPPSWRISEKLKELPSLTFKNNAFKLSGDNKAILADIAAKMKSAPDANITVYAYPTGSGRQYMYNKRVENIKIYLVEREGISADRITTNCEVGGGDKNIVEIKPDN